MQQSLIIQCSDFFEYKLLKDKLSGAVKFINSTYTIYLLDGISDEFIQQIINHAPTCKITRKVFTKHKATYIKIKE